MSDISSTFQNSFISENNSSTSISTKNTSVSDKDIAIVNVENHTVENTSIDADNENNNQHIIMAVDCRKNSVGCAVYDKEKKKMMCFLDFSAPVISFQSEFETIFRQCTSETVFIIYDLLLLTFFAYQYVILTFLIGLGKLQIKPGLLLIPSSFPEEIEPVIKNRDETTEYKIKVRPANDFSKRMALENLSKSFSKNPSIFQPDYEQTITHPHIWIRQSDSNMEVSQLNTFNDAFFDEENQIGVSIPF